MRYSIFGDKISLHVRCLSLQFSLCGATARGVQRQPTNAMWQIAERKPNKNVCTVHVSRVQQSGRVHLLCNFMLETMTDVSVYVDACGAHDREQFHIRRNHLQRLYVYKLPCAKCIANDRQLCLS